MTDRQLDTLRRLHNNVVGSVILETRMRLLHGTESPEAREASTAANADSRVFWAHVDSLEAGL